MLNHYFNKASVYILKKSILERIILSVIFVLAMYVLWAFLRYDREILAESFEASSNSNLQGSIATLAKKYDIKSKCARLFCSGDESVLKDFVSSKADSIYMYFSCDSLKCFEFVREVESLPLAFIDEIMGANVLLLNVRDFSENAESAKDIKEDSKDSKFESLDFLVNEEEQNDDIADDSAWIQSLDSKDLPLQWRQNIKMKLRLESI